MCSHILALLLRKGEQPFWGLLQTPYFDKFRQIHEIASAKEFFLNNLKIWGRNLAKKTLSELFFSQFTKFF